LAQVNRLKLLLIATAFLTKVNMAPMAASANQAPSLELGADTMVDAVTLVKRAAGDLGAATIGGAMVAPFVAAVDKAIAQAAAGQATAWASVGASMRELMSNPISYVRQPAFRFIWILYGGTYSAANLFTTFEEMRGKSMPLGKTASIFAANCSLSLWKDSNFARLFSDKPPAPVPKQALASWYVRDFVSMGVIFTAPPIVAKQMQDSMGIEKSVAEPVAQFALPLMLQPFVAPFHLYGYVLYNQPNATAAERKVIMKREIWGAVQMRWLRIIPPFSIGANLNRELRKAFKPPSA
jgi:hypothetical protein